MRLPSQLKGEWLYDEELCLTDSNKKLEMYDTCINACGKCCIRIKSVPKFCRQLMSVSKKTLLQYVLLESLLMNFSITTYVPCELFFTGNTLKLTLRHRGRRGKDLGETDGSGSMV